MLTYRQLCKSIDAAIAKGAVLKPYIKGPQPSGEMCALSAANYGETGNRLDFMQAAFALGLRHTQMYNFISGFDRGGDQRTIYGRMGRKVRVKYTRCHVLKNADGKYYRGRDVRPTSDRSKALVTEGWSEPGFSPFRLRLTNHTK